MSPVNPSPAEHAAGCSGSESSDGAPMAVRQGWAYWRSLEDRANSPEFRQYMEREFPEGADRLEGDDRRQFLRVMGASFALAGVGLAACRRMPETTIVPYAARPADRTPGVPVHYATAMELGGVASGLLVKSFDGRPLKIEGNPDHPFNQGACDSLSQASVLELYDPTRSRLAMRKGQPVGSDGFAQFEAFATERFGGLASRGGEGLAVLSEAFAGPSMADAKKRFMARYPKAIWCEWEPINDDTERAGLAMAFGRSLRPEFRFDQAQVVVSLGSDFLRNQPASLKWARDFAKGRRIENPDPTQQQVSRLYAFEPGLSLVGANADDRVPVRGSDLAAVAAMLAQRAGVEIGDASLKQAIAAMASSSAASRLTAQDLEVLDAAAKDLADHRGSSLVVAGPNQPAAVHAFVAMLNNRLGNTGKTVMYREVPERPLRAEALARAVRRALLRQGLDARRPRRQSRLRRAGGPGLRGLPEEGRGVDTPLVPSQRDERRVLLASAAGPLPRELGRRPRLGRHDLARAAAHRAARLDAAGRPQCARDGRDHDRRRAVRRLPARASLDDGANRHERRRVRAPLAEEPQRRHRAGDRVRHGERVPSRERGRQGLRVAAGAAGRSGARARVHPRRHRLRRTLRERRLAAGAARADHEDHLGQRPADVGRDGPLDGPEDRRHGEGLRERRRRNAFARRGGRPRAGPGRGHDGPEPRLRARRDRRSDRRRRGLRRLSPSHDRGAGDRGGRAGREGRRHLRLRPHAGSRRRRQRSSRKCLPRGFRSVCRPLSAKARSRSTASIRTSPSIARTSRAGSRCGTRPTSTARSSRGRCRSTCRPASAAAPASPPARRRTTCRSSARTRSPADARCTGSASTATSAATIRRRSRRRSVMQPVACQHCENAPCEQVCPVAATVHDEEGLNVMVYNRCIGTRYCSNNCPYKVRRFNYFDYQRRDPVRQQDGLLRSSPTTTRRTGRTTGLEMQFNPDVTVRIRGVMEKCTFCTQRISQAKIAYKNQWRSRAASSPRRPGRSPTAPSCRRAARRARRRRSSSATSTIRTAASPSSTAASSATRCSRSSTTKSASAVPREGQQSRDRPWPRSWA